MIIASLSDVSAIDRSNNDDPSFLSNSLVEILMDRDSFVHLNTRVKQKERDVRTRITSANVNDIFIIG